MDGSVSRANHDAGFTLIEVLVALVILVAGLVALNQAFDIGIRSSRSADYDGKVAHLADNLLAELGRSKPLGVGTIWGEDVECGRWTMRIETLSTRAREHGASLLTAYTVRLDIFPSGTKSTPVHFETLVLSPEPLP